MTSQRWILGITGASGMKYALRLLDVLSSSGHEVHVIISDAALRVLQIEEKIKLSQSKLSSKDLLGREAPNIFFHSPRDFAASVASGSFQFEGMVICPCSMGTLGAIASGYSQNLIHRAADVTMKEGRRLVIVPRETPLSAIHLENMLKLSRFGASIVPAMPGFYHKPLSISDLVDMMVMKIMDQMHIPSNLAERWGETSPEPLDKENVFPLRQV